LNGADENDAAAKLRRFNSRSLQKEKPPEGGFPALTTVQY